MRDWLILLAVLTWLLWGIAANAAGPQSPSDPNAVVQAAVVDLLSVPSDERPFTRYLSRWPVDAHRHESLDQALLFWTNSLSSTRHLHPLRVTPSGLYRLDIRDYGWRAEAWETLAAADPYLSGSWVDPGARKTLTNLTGSRQAVLRADWFIGRTSLDVGGRGFLKGFYSLFLDLPKTERELFAKFGARRELGKRLLSRGGAVLDSEPALHNRELELIPTNVGRDQSFLWRSLDGGTSIGDQSVLENFRATIRAEGREYIGTLLNGLHYYYLTDGAGNQASEVPTNLAQNRRTVPQHDVTVRNPWSCVACHGGTGINSFRDVVGEMILDADAGLGVIAKGAGAKEADEERRALEEYYLSGLQETIQRQSESYLRIVREATGLDGPENAENYIGWVQGYLYGRLDLHRAAAETGMTPEAMRAAVAASGKPLAVRLRAGGGTATIDREQWESVYGPVLLTLTYQWDVTQEIETEKQQHGNADEPIAPYPNDPPGYRRFLRGGVHHIVDPRGGVHRRDGSRWIRIGG